MKIVSLRLRNINCFRDDIYLDFAGEPMSSSSLFAITGPTGSGKTTLLDAICVALYNKTPRLDGNGNKSQVNLLSQGADEGFAEVIFSVNGSRYLAEWRAKRKKNGDIKPEVKLIRHDTGELITSRGKGKGKQDMADMSVEEAVSKILGIDFVAFKRSILLAQGEFASFLKADAEKKREILEATTGMGIYELLKDTLNQQATKVKKEHEVAGAGLETIPEVAPGDIEAAEVELESVKEQLLKLSGEKSALEKEKESEQRRTDAYRKLLDSRKQQHLLQSRNEEVETIRREMELAVKAGNIRSEMDSYFSQNEQLERLKLLLDGAKKEVEKSKQAFAVTKSEYDISGQEFEKSKIEADIKRKAYDEASTIETRSKELFGEAGNKRKDAQAIQEKVGQVEAVIRQKKDEVSALGKASETAKSFLEKNPLPDNPEEVLANVSGTAAVIKGVEKTLDERKVSLKKTEAEISELDTDLEKLSEESKSIDAIKNGILTKIETTNKELNPLIREGNLDYWRTIKSAWDDVRVSGGKFPEQYNTFLHLFNAATPTNSQKNFLDTINLYKGRIDRLALEITAAGEKLKRCEAEEKLVAVTNQAVIMRSEHLTEGAPCPVCGSGNHPWSGKTEPDIEEQIATARENVEYAKSGLESLKGNLDKTLLELSGISKDRVRECEKRIGQIEILLKEKTETENELKLVIQQAEANTSWFESSARQKEKQDEEKRKLVTGIETLEDNIKEKRSVFIELMPLVFRTEPVESALVKFRTVISTARRYAGELEENRHKISACETSIQENSGRLTEENGRLNTLLEAAKQYEDDADRLKEQVLEMTGGTGVDAARSALAAHLESMETRRNTLMDKHNACKTLLTGSEVKLQGLENDSQALSGKFNDARLKYTHALGSSGFSSIEEHKSAFREQLWISQNKLVIEQYEKDVHAVDGNIKTHESVFAEKPYAPDELQDIIERETALVSSIEENNSIKGGMLKNIQTLTENLDKRKEQEKKLDSTRKEVERWQKLQDVMPFNSLRDFALKTMFDLLIRFANSQLSDITSRYALKAVDMRDMVVIDRWNAGEERPVETLSGGESFLVSLSLALALSELSKGRSRLESLFLDEGFGTLDSETLDSALCALESLRLSGRTIGIISHIDQLTRRIPVRIEVRKTGNGSSKINVRG